MPGSTSLRATLPLVAVGLLLLAVSVALVTRDLTNVRDQAESEVLAVAETSALAIQFAPPAETASYLSGLLKHPSIVTATVYSSNGEPITQRRAPAAATTFMERITPSLGQAVVACRAVGARTVCLEADPAYYRRRLAHMVIPHALLLAASALLLVVAMILGKGSNRRQIIDLTRVVKGAAEESNYALRAAEMGGASGQLGKAINTLLEQMQQRDLMLRRRTTEVESANRELEAFSYSVSHDLRSPLASLDGFSKALEDDCRDQLDDSGKEYLKWIRDGVQQMKNLVAGLLQMSSVSRAELKQKRVDLSALAASIAESLRQQEPSRSVDFSIEPGLVVDGDERLLFAVLQNLMSNSMKFTRKRERAEITFGSMVEMGRRRYFVRDNGAGFDSTRAARMFTPFQRLHSTSEFEGTGIGLATVRRIIERHGGTIWAEGEVDRGATFYFTLGESGGESAGSDQRSVGS